VVSINGETGPGLDPRSMTTTLGDSALGDTALGDIVLSDVGLTRIAPQISAIGIIERSNFIERGR